MVSTNVDVTFYIDLRFDAVVELGTSAINLSGGVCACG